MVVRRGRSVRLGRLVAGAQSAEVLLPAAERAVTALEKVQAGFFVQLQLGEPGVEVPVRAGQLKWLHPATGRVFVINDSNNIRTEFTR